MTLYLELEEIEEEEISILVSDEELEEDREALIEAIAFQVGKDWGLDWPEARSEARRLVNSGQAGRRAG
jgi:hypothetical protein